MLIFLKLGGSLITDKDLPRTHRPEVLARLAREIAQAREARPEMRLVLGHGSGSFGHVEAYRYNTRRGARTSEQWRGFAEVWEVARELNLLVTRALRQAGLPVIALPPSASARASAGRLAELSVEPLRAVLDHGLVPLVHGDVAVDDTLGGTIISTEEVFFFLARRLHPALILLAGVETGVYSDYPAGRTVIPEITPGNIESLSLALQGSASTDVTGGMLSKVTGMLQLCQEVAGLEVRIFSGLEAGEVERALQGRPAGTAIHAQPLKSASSNPSS